MLYELIRMHIYYWKDYSIGALVIVYSFFAYEERTNRMMKVGAASLEVYLIHTFILQRLEIAKEEIGVAAVLLAALLLSLMFAQVLYQFLGWLSSNRIKGEGVKC